MIVEAYGAAVWIAPDAKFKRKDRANDGGADCPKNWPSLSRNPARIAHLSGIGIRLISPSIRPIVVKVWERR
ncbi:hypothetical protein A9Q96_08735 [Rhodobacterales bacterium 52_120_T64]|nr:hypothetical protein A9Q96_08735 [Rhodobacterales bacterium 52_120_T64]